MLNDFKAFIMRGNVVDMAIGIIIGGAFGKIVSSLVNDLILPPLGLFLGGVNFTDLSIVLKEGVAESVDASGNVVVAVAPVVIAYGSFIQVVLDFLIIAFVIFIAIRMLTNLKKKEELAPTVEPPAPSEEVVLLSEIRDLLSKK